MEKYKYIDIKERPSIIYDASRWFASKWNVPSEEYLKCMKDYISSKTKYGWYICEFNKKIIGGVGVIKNDFHSRKDLFPNICGVYTEEEYRNQGIAGQLLNMAINDLKSKGISPIYLVTDHTSFYERYGWRFKCMVLCDDGNTSRMYVHR